MNVVQAADLARLGIGRNEIRGLLRSGALVRLRQGAYLDGEEADAVKRHRHLLAATLPQLQDGAVFSHFSAGIVHGFAVPTTSLAQAWVSRNSNGGGHLSPNLHEFKAAFRDEDVVVVNGLPVTVMARTAIDLARRGPLEYGLAAADVALARGVRREELEEQVRLWPRRPGMARGRTVAELADGRSESFGESLSRLAMWQVGLPKPELQVKLRIRGKWYRSDFGWPELGVLGEFDGRIKYDELVPAGLTAADIIMDEKEREEDLRSLGWYVTRWGIRVARSPLRLKAQLERAFLNAAGLPPVRYHD